MDELVSMVPAAGVGGQRARPGGGAGGRISHGDEPAAGQRRHRHDFVRGQRIVVRQGEPRRRPDRSSAPSGRGAPAAGWSRPAGRRQSAPRAPRARARRCAAGCGLGRQGRLVRSGGGLIGDEAGGVRACACMRCKAAGTRPAASAGVAAIKRAGLAARDLAGALADLPHAGQRPLHVLVQQESLLGGGHARTAAGEQGVADLGFSSCSSRLIAGCDRPRQATGGCCRWT